MLDLNCGMNFDLGHDFDLFNVITDNYQGDFRCQYAVDSFGYTTHLLGVGYIGFTLSVFPSVLHAMSAL